MKKSNKQYNTKNFLFHFFMSLPYYRGPCPRKVPLTVPDRQTDRRRPSSLPWQIGYPKMMGARYWAPWSCAWDLHVHPQTLSPIFTKPLHIGFLVVQVKKHGSGESSGQGLKPPAKEKIIQGSEPGSIRLWSPCAISVPLSTLLSASFTNAAHQCLL